MIASYLRWKRFEHPPQLFLGGIDIDEDGSRAMLHAWEIIDGEFKTWQDEEADRRAKQGNRTPSGGGETGDDSGPPAQRMQVDAAGFPKLKHNYTSVT